MRKLSGGVGWRSLRFGEPRFTVAWLSKRGDCKNVARANQRLAALVETGLPAKVDRLADRDCEDARLCTPQRHPEPTTSLLPAVAPSPMVMPPTTMAPRAIQDLAADDDGAPPTAGELTGKPEVRRSNPDVSHIR